MARPGVTYHDVANAALKLQGQGTYPTIENVRATLGTGSSSTIAPHLKSWRMQQDQSQQLSTKENLPQELIALMKGLWEKVIYLADEKIALINQDAQQERQQFEAQINTLQTSYQHEQAQNLLLLQEKTELLAIKAKNEEELNNLQKENADLIASKHTLEKQLEEKQDRIEELNKLHRQVQTNLEHYRETTREQRLLDQQKFSQREQVLEQSLHQLQQSLKTTEQNKLLTEQHCLKLSDEKQTLTTAFEKLSVQIEEAQNKYQESEKKCTEYLNSLNHTQDQLKTTLHQLSVQIQLSNDAKTQLALVTQELTYTKEKLQQLLDQHHALTQEKWYLLQEKSQLEGQVKQLDKLITKHHGTEITDVSY